MFFEVDTRSHDIGVTSLTCAGIKSKGPCTPADNIISSAMSGSINDRLQKDVKSLEVQMWRALRDSGPAVFEYTAEDDCTFAIDGMVLDKKSEPTLKEYMENHYRPWTTYEMHDLRVIEIGLMAAATVRFFHLCQYELANFLFSFRFIRSLRVVTTKSIPFCAQAVGRKGQMRSGS